MKAASRLRWRVTGGLFTAAVVVFGAAGFASAVLEEPTPAVALVASRTTETVHDEYAFFEPTLSVVNHSGLGAAIEVKEGAAGRLLIDREISWTLDRPDRHESWDGRTLLIDAAPCPGCSARYTITVPEGTEVIRR